MWVGKASVRCFPRQVYEREQGPGHSGLPPAPDLRPGQAPPGKGGQNSARHKLGALFQVWLVQGTIRTHGPVQRAGQSQRGLALQSREWAFKNLERPCTTDEREPGPGAVVTSMQKPS